MISYKGMDVEKNNCRFDIFKFFVKYIGQHYKDIRQFISYHMLQFVSDVISHYMKAGSQLFIYTCCKQHSIALTHTSASLALNLNYSNDTSWLYFLYGRKLKVSMQGKFNESI